MEAEGVRQDEGWCSRDVDCRRPGRQVMSAILKFDMILIKTCLLMPKIFRAVPIKTWLSADKKLLTVTKSLNHPKRAGCYQWKLLHRQELTSFFAVIFSVNGANPNGDPLDGNRSRRKNDDMGEVSDACIKRKIRNRLMEAGHNIFQIDDVPLRSLPANLPLIPNLQSLDRGNCFYIPQDPSKASSRHVQAHAPLSENRSGRFVAWWQ